MLINIGAVLLERTDTVLLEVAAALLVLVWYVSRRG
jgi:hypothetical protein